MILMHQATFFLFTVAGNFLKKEDVALNKEAIMYDVISYHEKKKWEEKLKLLNKKDVFYSHAYSDLCYRLGEGEPFLFYYEDKNSRNKLAYVFIKRRIENFSPTSNHRLTGEFFDITTPSYGYGGPLYDDKDQNFLTDFTMQFEEYCQKENIVCEFVKFHPLLQNQRDLENFMDVRYDRETVYMNLYKSEEDIFNVFHKNHKRNVRKAQKNQLEFLVFQNQDALKQIEIFYFLYKETMDKLKASRSSYFSSEYLYQLFEGFQNQALIGAVFYQGQMISAALCLHDGSNMHYHLGCSKKEFLNLGGNPFLFYHLALWGKENGLKRFHLGGGHSDLHNGGLNGRLNGRDSLLQFKYRFYPEGLLHFYVGRKIYIPEVYKKLVCQWEEYNGQKSEETFFPAYRSQPKNEEILQESN